jgi:protein-S-isoprenylcysteine O-methyltransferase Ste14
MTFATARNRKLLGAALVALQLSCMLLLTVLAVPSALAGALPTPSLLLAATAVALFLWILMHNRLGNFNIQPMPKAQGVLVTSGPYRWIRHPMYSAVLLGGAALAPMADVAAIGWGIWFCLALVLWAKSVFEEQWMQERHPGYRAYMQVSKRFIPLLF